MPFVLQYKLSKKVIQLSIQILKSIGNMEAIPEKVLPILLQYFLYCNINNPDLKHNALISCVLLCKMVHQFSYEPCPTCGEWHARKKQQSINSIVKVGRVAEILWAIAFLFNALNICLFTARRLWMLQTTDNIGTYATDTAQRSNNNNNNNNLYSS